VHDLCLAVEDDSIHWGRPSASSSTDGHRDDRASLLRGNRIDLLAEFPMTAGGRRLCAREMAVDAVPELRTVLIGLWNAVAERVVRRGSGGGGAMKQLTLSAAKGDGQDAVRASFAALAHRAVLADADVDAADLHLLLTPEIKETHNFRRISRPDQFDNAPLRRLRGGLPLRRDHRNVGGPHSLRRMRGLRRSLSVRAITRTAKRPGAGSNRPRASVR
jgi:hypothetical protein